LISYTIFLALHLSGSSHAHHILILHYRELHNLYHSCSIRRLISLVAGFCGHSNEPLGIS